MILLLIALYLVAIVTANLLIVWFGPAVSIVNAFIFSGISIHPKRQLTTRYSGLAKLATGKGIKNERHL